MNRKKVVHGIGLILQLLSIIPSYKYAYDPILSWSLFVILFSLGSLIIVFNGGYRNNRKALLSPLSQLCLHLLNGR